MTAQLEEFTVLCARVPVGIDEHVVALINGKIDSFDPDHWLLIQPDTYLFYFRQKKNGDERSKKAISILDGLRGLNERLAGMKLGKSAGEITALISASGEIEGFPVGAAVSEAQRATYGAA